MKKFFICSTTFCMERMVDNQKIYDYLVRNGWHSVRNSSKADLIIISTCSFGKEEDDSSIDYIKYYSKKKSKLAKTIIAGCLPSINPGRLKETGEFATVSPTNLDKLDEILNSEIRYNDISEPNRVSTSEISYNLFFKKLLRCRYLVGDFFKQFKLKKGFFNRYIFLLKNLSMYIFFIKSHVHPFLAGDRDKLFYLKIAQGCLGSCSYCAKRFATGTLQSKSPVQIITEFKKGLEEGFRKFYMITEDSGCYGLDIGTNIIGLLDKIFKAGNGYDYKLAISNLNAHWFVKYYAGLENILINNQKNILFLQIPVQSGSDRILKMMNRKCLAKDVEKCLSDLREKAPELNITTDMIVGFPGETDEDFMESKKFMEKMKFEFADIFGYEDRSNTAACRMTGKIAAEVIEDRKFALMKIQKKGAKISSLFKKFTEAGFNLK